MNLKEEGPDTSITPGNTNSNLTRLLNLQEPSISKSSPMNGPSPSWTQILWIFKTTLPPTYNTCTFPKVWCFLPKSSGHSSHEEPTCGRLLPRFGICWHSQVKIHTMEINSSRRPLEKASSHHRKKVLVVPVWPPQSTFIRLFLFWLGFFKYVLHTFSNVPRSS
jgi:hypothetical protein